MENLKSIDKVLKTLLDRMKKLETEVKFLSSMEHLSSQGRLFAAGKLYAFEEERSFLQEILFNFYIESKEGKK